MWERGIVKTPPPDYVLHEMQVRLSERTVVESFVKIVLKGLLLILIVAIVSNSAQSHDTCSNRTNPWKWTLSGNSGNLFEGPGGDQSWKDALRANVAQMGGVPTCRYTFVVDTPPPNYWGHWSGECFAPDDGCNAPPMNFCPTCNTAGQPINLANGNTFIVQSDLALPGLNDGLRLSRTWNSVWPSEFGAPTGMFGPNWLSTYEERVFVGNGDAVNYMVYAKSDGSFWYFSTTDGTHWTLALPADRTATLTSGVSQWTLTFANGDKRLFDTSSGNLLAIVDRNGNTTQLTYDSSSRLTTVTDPASRTITFAYGSGSSRLATTVTASVGPTLSYSYDLQGRLSQVTRPDSSTVSFTYNTQSMITTVTDSQSKVIESHTYDSKGRGLTSSRANGVEQVTISYPN